MKDFLPFLQETSLEKISYLCPFPKENKAPQSFTVSYSRYSTFLLFSQAEGIQKGFFPHRLPLNSLSQAYLFILVFEGKQPIPCCIEYVIWKTSLFLKTDFKIFWMNASLRLKKEGCLYMRQAWSQCLKLRAFIASTTCTELTLTQLDMESQKMKAWL